jgi:hypothetical protein
MDIFIVEDYKVMPTAEALSIKAFKNIWNSSDEKETLLSKFAYIEFMCSYKPTNPFIGYLDPEERKQKIIEKIDMTIEECDDDLIVEAIKVYEELQNNASPSLNFYMAALEASKTMIDFFNDVDLNKKNSRTGNPLYKPADITKALKDTYEILKTMNSLKEKVHQEIYDSSKGKGGRVINYFEKG